LPTFCTPKTLKQTMDAKGGFSVQLFQIMPCFHGFEIL